MKHEAWRHDPTAYGSTQPVAARYVDVDTRRHVNNIAVYGLHQEARQRWLMAARGGSAGLATGLADRVADRVAVRPAGDTPASHPPAGVDQRQHYPVAATLASRYGDFDADGGSSELAVMRGIEQARAALLKAAFAAAGGQPERDWVCLLVARIDLQFVHHRAPPAHWALASAVTHTGRSSAVLRVAIFDGLTLQATADCVMVYTDPAGAPGAAALPLALRAALQSFHWSTGDTPCP